MTYRLSKYVHGHGLGAINSDYQCFWMDRTTPKIATFPWSIWAPSNA